MKYISSYRNLWETKELHEKKAILWDRLSACDLCGHKCGVNRLLNQTGICRTLDKIKIASYGPHFGEESPLVGKYGSGAIFFSGCNLQCVFCQNWDISQMQQGRQISEHELAKIMLSLQKRGCHNINLVTPTHYVPQILSALIIACEKGLQIPIVYNCGGYESVEVLQTLHGVIDIYMPDVKYANTKYAFEFSGPKDYPDIMKTSLIEMHKQVGDLVIDKNGIARRGLIIRHLVLPNKLAGTSDIMEFIANKISKDSYINIMKQYHPRYRAYDYPLLNRCITSKEYKEAVQITLNAGLKRLAR